MSDTVELNLRGLDKFIKSLKGDLPTVRIGILGNGTARRGDKQSNAEIGYKHEFGASGMPMRSFLRVPLTDHMQEYLDKAGAFDPDAFKNVIKTGSIKIWVQKIAVIAEQIVQDGFASGGFGKWAAWKPGYQNRTGQILVDSQQLRNSITSEVK